jgi:hypothetical protein
MGNKFYPYVEPEETLEQMVYTLSKGLKRALTEQEMRIIYWLSDTNYETRGILLDLFKELSERSN